MTRKMYFMHAQDLKPGDMLRDGSSVRLVEVSLSEVWVWTRASTAPQFRFKVHASVAAFLEPHDKRVLYGKATS